MQVADITVVPLPNITNNVFVWCGDRLLYEGTEDSPEDYYWSGNLSLIAFSFEIEVGDIVRIVTVDPLDGTPCEWRQLEFTSRVGPGSPIDTEMGFVR